MKILSRLLDRICMAIYRRGERAWNESPERDRQREARWRELDLRSPPSETTLRYRAKLLALGEQTKIGAPLSGDAPRPIEA